MKSQSLILRFFSFLGFILGMYICMVTLWSVVFIPVVVITVLTTMLGMKDGPPFYVRIFQCTLINVLFIGIAIAIFASGGFTGIGLHLGDNVFQEDGGYVKIRHQIYIDNKSEVNPLFTYYWNKGILHDGNVLVSFNSNNEKQYHYTKDGKSRHEPSLLFTMRKNSIISWRRFYDISHPYFLANWGYISILLSVVLAPIGVLLFLFGDWHEELIEDIIDKCKGKKKSSINYANATYADFKKDEERANRDLQK